MSTEEIKKRMYLRIKIEQGLLWFFVVLCAIVIGAGFYEMRVTVPLWAHAPPESVWYWETQRLTDPANAPNSGMRFWIFVTPLHILVSVVTLVAAAMIPRGRHRKWVMISTIIFIAMHATALIWFVPVIDMLMNSKQLGISPDEIVQKANLWVMLSWFRLPIGVVGFIAGLRAMTLRATE